MAEGTVSRRRWPPAPSMPSSSAFRALWDAGNPVRVVWPLQLSPRRDSCLYPQNAFCLWVV
jgi:hypothetical protein